MVAHDSLMLAQWNCCQTSDSQDCRECIHGVSASKSVVTAYSRHRKRMLRVICQGQTTCVNYTLRLCLISVHLHNCPGTEADTIISTHSLKKGSWSSDRSSAPPPNWGSSGAMIWVQTPELQVFVLSFAPRARGAAGTELQRLWSGGKQQASPSPEATPPSF